MRVDWSDLSPLPRVNAWHRGLKSRTWMQVRDDFANLPKSGWRITAHLSTPLVPAEDIGTHLDGPLSWAALTVHPVASAYDTPPAIPLPIECLAILDGRPLWAITPLRPVGDVSVAAEYWHQRYPVERAELANKIKLHTKTGRYKDNRRPLFTQQTEKLVCHAIGHGVELKRCLDEITHLGKKCSYGYGRVMAWAIEPADDLNRDEILKSRPVPMRFFENTEWVGEYRPLQAWTPPYWYAPLWEPCIVPRQ